MYNGGDIVTEQIVPAYILHTYDEMPTPSGNSILVRLDWHRNEHIARDNRNANDIASYIRVYVLPNSTRDDNGMTCAVCQAHQRRGTEIGRINLSPGEAIPYNFNTGFMAWAFRNYPIKTFATTCCGC